MGGYFDERIFFFRKSIQFIDKHTRTCGWELKTHVWNMQLWKSTIFLYYFKIFQLKVEKDVFAGATSWEDKEYFTNVAENIINAVKSGQTEYDANVLSKVVYNPNNRGLNL